MEKGKSDEGNFPVPVCLSSSNFAGTIIDKFAWVVFNWSLQLRVLLLFFSPTFFFSFLFFLKYLTPERVWNKTLRARKREESAPAMITKGHFRKKEWESSPFHGSPRDSNSQCSLRNFLKTSMTLYPPQPCCGEDSFHSLHTVVQGCTWPSHCQSVRRTPGTRVRCPDLPPAGLCSFPCEIWRGCNAPSGRMGAHTAALFPLKSPGKGMCCRALLPHCHQTEAFPSHVLNIHTSAQLDSLTPGERPFKN